jgi:DNA-binding transcriptional ArsR family regulator
MAVRKAEMKRRLIEQRDRLMTEIEALRNKVAGLEMAIALLDADEVPHGAQEERSGRSSAKSAVLDLLREVGTTGLNAAVACEIAERRGAKLDRGTVSSLLSRLKRDGIVIYEDDRYRLKEFSPRKPDAQRTVDENVERPSLPLKVVHG